jgi:transposase
MRRIKYEDQIKESVEQLLSVEQSQKQGRLRDRVRFVRFLKKGRATTQQKAGELVGISSRQSQKLWKLYRRQGLEALVLTHHKGSWPKLSSSEQARLLQRLDAGDMSTQGQLLEWLKQEMNISYTQGGLSGLLARMKVKLKTGRPVHLRKDVAGEAAFKKTFSS